MMYLLKSVIGNLRAAMTSAIVRSVNDAGAAQTVTVQTHDEVMRADVEVAWPFGFSSVPPTDGAITVLLTIGGDVGNLVALPLGNAATRFGGLGPGEAVIYGGDGCRVRIKPGVVEVWAPEIKLFGNVTVDGNLTTTGDVADSHGTLDRLRGHYNEHVHPPAGAPPSPTDPE